VQDCTIETGRGLRKPAKARAIAMAGD
jgi:hypothetical protein